MQSVGVFEASDLSANVEVAMDILTRALFAKPDGLLYLFLNAGVSVDLLACAFETNTQVIEATLREAMRKREAIALANPTGSLEVVGAYRETG